MEILDQDELQYIRERERERERERAVIKTTISYLIFSSTKRASQPEPVNFSENSFLHETICKKF